MNYHPGLLTQAAIIGMRPPFVIGYTNTAWWLSESKIIFGHFSTGHISDGDWVGIVVRVTENETSIRVMVDHEEKGHLVDKIIWGDKL